MNGRGMSRREFLKVGGAGLAGCGGGEGMIYAGGPDDTGTLPKLIDGFNRKFEGEYSVEHREMPADTQGYFDQLRTEFQAGASNIAIWPAQLAANGWLPDPRGWCRRSTRTCRSRSSYLREAHGL